jgi:putative oxidoreductase
MKKILTVVYILFALMFINSGLNKLFNYIPMPDDIPNEVVEFNQHFKAIFWLTPLIAVVEILGGILFIFERTRALAAIMILPIMIGVLLTHLLMIPSGLPIAIVLLLINAFAIYQNKEKYLPLIQTSKDAI